MADDHIKVKLPQLPLYSGAVKNDDMIYVWEESTGVLKHATVGQLPFGQGGGGGQPLLGSPFMVKLGDPQVTVSGGDTIVSDARLAGKTSYPISSSQLNNAVFRPSEVTYDDVNGTVTITGFELQGGEVLALFPDGVAGSGSGGGSLQPILDRLAALEAMVAPFTPTGGGENAGRVWWIGEIETIPIGWAIDEDWKGVVPIAVDPTDSAINAPGKTTGTKTVKLTGSQQGKLTLGVMPGWSAGTSSVKQFRGLRMKPEGSGSWTFDIRSENYPEGQYTPDFTVGVGEATDAHSNMQPSKAGYWIKYVGV